jgi:hypothetical protein
MAIKKFLLVFGIGAIFYGLAGFFHIIGPGAAHSIFGEKWWLDNTENWIHLTAGLVSIIFALFLPSLAREIFAWIMTVLSISISIYSILVFHLLNQNIENPIEEVVYFTVGNIALWSMFYQMRQERKKGLVEMQKLSGNKIII